ncbi:type II secretion system F family protein [Streptomyces sp. MS06]|uniref:type II secretion system F family protein n=1 Tax=Streptomyces sp. MS06 TaxID=3385974 RepID=UPI0039A1797E
MSGDGVHGWEAVLGMLPALGWLGARRLAAVRTRRRVQRRLAGLMARETACQTPRLRIGDKARRWLPPLGAVGAGWVLVGGVAGMAVGVLGAVVLVRLPPRQAGRRSTAEADAAARQLPLAADLLAACIAAGAGPVVAAQAVGEALGGPVGGALARGAAEVRLGGEARGAWRRLAALPGARPLARLLERAETTGLPAAVPVARIAADARAGWTRAATERARRAAVAITAPVGLCFLPAFIALGVLPVVLGLATGVWGGGGR